MKYSKTIENVQIVVSKRITDYILPDEMFGSEFERWRNRHLHEIEEFRLLVLGVDYKPLHSIQPKEDRNIDTLAEEKVDAIIAQSITGESLITDDDE